MADQQFLDMVRKYIWDNMLWRNNNGYPISFENICQVIRNDIHRALSREYLFSLGDDYRENVKTCRKILAEHDSEVREIIEELLLKLDKKNAKDGINRITAEAILEPLLDRSGLKYFIEYQKTGVKIHVRLRPKKKAQLYMSYSRVRKESDQLVDNILKLRQMYDYFGPNSGIVNIPQDEENLFDKRE